MTSLSRHPCGQLRAAYLQVGHVLLEVFAKLVLFDSDTVPQLKCVGGCSHVNNLPHTVRCYNQGTDGKDVQV